MKNLKTYIIVLDPFSNGLDLTDIKTQLDREVDRLKLQTASPFGLVGGLMKY